MKTLLDFLSPVPSVANMWAGKDYIIKSVYDRNKGVFEDFIIKDDYVDMSQEWGDGWEQCPLELLILLGRFRVKIPYKEYKKINVHFIDGNSKNKHYLNLWYNFSTPIETYKKGFYYIPYYSRHFINREGQVWDSQYDRFAEKRDSKGYVYITAMRDIRITTDGRVIVEKHHNAPLHRLLALAFLPYNKNPSIETPINHIDSNPKNNSLENLEWSTPKDNVRHAIRCGNKYGRVEDVICYDYITGEESVFESVRDACTETGVGEATINRRLRYGDLNPINDRYSFKYISNTSPWLEEEGVNNGWGKVFYVEAMNIFTKEVYSAYGVKNMAKLLNLKEAFVSNFICGKLKRPIHGYMFRKKRGDPPFRHMSNIELSYYELAFSLGIERESCNPLVVTMEGKFHSIALRWEDFEEKIKAKYKFKRKVLYGGFTKEFRDYTGNTWRCFKLYSSRGSFDLSKEMIEFLEVVGDIS